MADNEKYLFKVVFLGDQGIGKTALKFTTIIGKFASHWDKIDSIGGGLIIYDNNGIRIGTTGTGDFNVKTVTLHAKTIDLQLWDFPRKFYQKALSNQLAYLLEIFFKRACICLVCYDINKNQSLNSVSKWIEEARKILRPDIPIGLVGCKGDLVSRVQEQRIDKIIKNFNCAFHIITSAREVDNIQSLMESTAKECFVRRKEN